MRLASDLVGWKIDIISETKVDELQDELRYYLGKNFEKMSAENMEYMFKVGFHSAENIINAEAAELTGVPGLDEETAMALQDICEDLLEARATGKLWPSEGREAIMREIRGDIDLGEAPHSDEDDNPALNPPTTSADLADALMAEAMAASAQAANTAPIASENASSTVATEPAMDALDPIAEEAVAATQPAVTAIRDEDTAVAEPVAEAATEAQQFDEAAQSAAEGDDTSGAHP